jgi:hypothetical protein
LILVALPIELRGIAPALGSTARSAHERGVFGRLGEHRAIARLVGIGGGAADIVEAERPGLVISCGFAGALEESLSTGELILATAVRDESGDREVAPEPVRRAVRAALAGRARVTEGELVSATRVAVTREEKRSLARPGLAGVEMESWAAARAAARAGVPWLALRTVLDPLDVDLPTFTRRPDAGRPIVALRHALRGPGHALEVVRLGVRANRALRTLREALVDLGPALVQLVSPEAHA